jgi:hypothetical protein
VTGGLPAGANRAVSPWPVSEAQPRGVLPVDSMGLYESAISTIAAAVIGTFGK